PGRLPRSACRYGWPPGSTWTGGATPTNPTNPAARAAAAATRPTGRRAAGPVPDLSLEREAGGVVAGIDEVGRGPWAGPVVAAAVVIDVGCIPSALAGAIDDSKKLSPEKRNEIAGALAACARIGI